MTDLMQRMVDYANRPNPYPLYEELRRTPVVRQEDGTYLVGTYREIVQLLHDPRLSSDVRNRADAPPASEEGDGMPLSFILLDPPEHDLLRRLATRHFGPPHRPAFLDGMRADMARIVRERIETFAGREEVDVVDDLAYPFPVTVICDVLGVPHEDEPLFHEWAEGIIQPGEATGPEDLEARRGRAEQAIADAREYFAGLAEERARAPRDDMLSGLVTDDGPEGRMSRDEVLSTAVLLLVAGHETTVNMITNGTLALLRHPEVLERLRREPGLIARVFEELIRYDTPVQFVPFRTTVADVEVAGTTIPKSAAVTLVLGSGNRDPAAFREPDRFDPDRPEREHLGFGGGIHYCFGAPLARMETQLALGELVRRLENPRLVTDTPPYRRNAFLRGPRHLQVAFDGVRD
ncbi:cytochrome P450 [Georgenia thermotolerans]|uniref:Cytochrome P450 n=1 Tax=Georgenia thermotolerans TaxID=527326 RepID=A0A7J5UMB9_9MICO|nr:cytochrome P450 [Georgenia thermotolerans]KAE8763506.1 cytochrome P450 [Georgenia thermotolerans]